MSDQFLDQWSLSWVLGKASDDLGHEVMNGLVCSLNQVRECLFSEEFVQILNHNPVKRVISHCLCEGILQGQDLVQRHTEAENV